MLNEVIRSFGEAVKKGWKPLRTIVFASWDGEEYGLLGSTEWVEEYLPWLTHANVAYLNLDVSVRGTVFHASAAPLLNGLLYNVTAQVPSPNQTVAGQTVYDLWDKRISTMGSGSDFTAFQDFAGIPCIDMGFTAGALDSVYHYHSNYDSFHWMATYGDPGFIYHRTMAQVLGLMTAKLADEPLLAFEAATYATELDRYLGKVEDKLIAATTSAPPSAASEPELTDDEKKGAVAALRGAVLGNEAVGDPAAFRRSLARLHEAVGGLLVEATKLDDKRAALEAEVKEEIPWWRWPKKLRLAHEVRKVNTKYKYLERDFLYPEGLDGRSWFKHVVFAPGLWTGYSGGKFLYPLVCHYRLDSTWPRKLTRLRQPSSLVWWRALTRRTTTMRSAGLRLSRTASRRQRPTSRLDITAEDAASLDERQVAKGGKSVRGGIVFVIVQEQDWIHVKYGKHRQALPCSAPRLDRSWHTHF